MQHSFQTALIVNGYLRDVSTKQYIDMDIITICQLYLLSINSNQNQVLFINDDRILLHRGPKSHQERPERITSMTTALLKSNLLSKCLYITKVKPCTYADLLTTHDESYVDKLYTLSSQFENNKNNQSDYKFSKDFENVYYNKYSLISCRVSAGSCITMIKYLLSNYNNIEYGICLVRPPGHHCNNNTPLDFCLINNVAITANYVHDNYPGMKTCIIDIDIHHGNGTQDIFYDTGKEKDVLFISLHYKNEGKGDFKNIGKYGMNINIPFPFHANIGNYEYYMAWINIVIPILKQYKADIILISMGFDACINDLIGKFKLTPKFYALLMWLIITKCDKKCKIGMVFEGGYNIRMLPKCIQKVLKSLLSSNEINDKFNNEMMNMIKDLKPSNKRVYTQTKKRLLECIEYLSRYWDLSSFGLEVSV